MIGLTLIILVGSVIVFVAFIWLSMLYIVPFLPRKQRNMLDLIALRSLRFARIVILCMAIALPLIALIPLPR